MEPWKYLLEMSESLIKWERRGGEFAFYAECKCKKFGLYFSVFEPDLRPGSPWMAIGDEGDDRPAGDVKVVDFRRRIPDRQ